MPLSEFRTTFPIPMRGNEARTAHEVGVGFEFPIPMRGNESPSALGRTHRLESFQSP